MPNRFLRALNGALTALICLVNGACRSEAPKLDQLPAESGVVTTALKPTADTVAPISTWKILPAGLGPLRAGMSVPAVQSHLPQLALPADIGTAECTYGRSPALPVGAVLMFARGSLARVDVVSGRLQTDLGARIGDTEDQIKLLYGKSAGTTPHKYTGGHYMTVLSETDSSLRIVFETDGVKVIRFRSGRTPEVEHVEGCG